MRGRSPRRPSTRKPGGRAPVGLDPHPQCVSRASEKRFGRNRRHRNAAAVAATRTRATGVCQFMNRNPNGMGAASPGWRRTARRALDGSGRHIHKHCAQVPLVSYRKRRILGVARCGGWGSKASGVNGAFPPESWIFPRVPCLRVVGTAEVWVEDREGSGLVRLGAVKRSTVWSVAESVLVGVATRRPHGARHNRRITLVQSGCTPGVWSGVPGSRLGAPVLFRDA
jgi:hypothetical protein